jgi:HEAT repeat protein
MSGFKPPTLNGVPIPYDAPIPDLRAAIKDPGPKAWAAIRALAEKSEPDALTTLIEVSKSPDPHVRRAAMEGIGMHRSGQAACAEVCQALDDRDSLVIRAALAAAANLRLEPAHAQIIGLVTAAEESTRLAASRAPEGLWRPLDFDVVFERYLHDRSDSVRQQAAWTLHKNVGAEHWERVFSVWSKDTLPRHRIWACQLAGRFGSRAVVPVLEELRADSDGHVRDMAERALQQA